MTNINTCNEYRITKHSKGFSVNYYYSDIPVHDSFLAEAVCEALADRADIYNPVCVEMIAIVTEQIREELETQLVGRG